MDVPPSLIDELKSKVTKLSYNKYLKEIKVSARALKDQKIRFDFPVTAVIGTNGGGKSTVLGASALAYKSIKPSEFFPKSNVGDRSMANWRVDFEILDRTINKTGTISRNARFVSAKWRRDDAVDRNVLFFPISRTVPAGEKSKYRKFIGTQQATGATTEELPDNVPKQAGSILGKDLSDFKIARLNEGDQDFIFLGIHKLNDYSQFHFGAGEASIIDIVLKLYQAEQGSLILIEELENGLHPLAVERLVSFLVSIASERKLQVIFTTHSSYALKLLPPEAIWACIDGNAQQGKLSIESLRAITGIVEKQQVVFVEDEFARDWIIEIFRQCAPELLHSVEVHAAGGFPYALQVTESHNKNPAIKSPAYCVVDGDTDALESPERSLFKFPGGVPESEVYQFILGRVDEFASLLKQRCQIPTINQDDLVKILGATLHVTTDAHMLFERLGNSLGYVSEIIVRRAFLSIYTQEHPHLLRDLIDKLNKFTSSSL